MVLQHQLITSKPSVGCHLDTALFDYYILFTVLELTVSATGIQNILLNSTAPNSVDTRWVTTQCEVFVQQKLLYWLQHWEAQLSLHLLLSSLVLSQVKAGCLTQARSPELHQQWFFNFNCSPYSHPTLYWLFSGASKLCLLHTTFSSKLHAPF